MRITLLALLAFLVIGCAPQPEVSRDNPENIVTIAQGTQYRQENLRIGVVSVSEYSATLAIIIEAENPDEAQAPNHVRETLAIGEGTVADGFSIKVLQTKTGIGGLLSGQSDGSVTLRISRK